MSGRSSAFGLPAAIVTVAFSQAFRAMRRARSSSSQERPAKAGERLRKPRDQILPGRGRKIVSLEQRVADRRNVPEPLDHAID
jgi:hypothetical protein